MVSAANAITPRTGWLRSRQFDVTFVQGVAALALLSGGIVVARPELFKYVLAADLWLLGYHHVIATFTRLAFDKKSLREYHFFVFVLPILVFAATFGLAWTVGVWVIGTVYLYWQWFHYTRQSWGISQVYKAKSGGLVDDTPLFSKMSFYLIPTWGILHRSWQAPDTFLYVELRVIPVPELLVNAVGVAAVASVLAWGYRRFTMWRNGALPVAHTWYMLSHYVIFIVGYLVIPDITFGWLVINVWHNAQYILFVWLFNTNRYKNGIDTSAPFLSEISQSDKIWRYLFVCVAISTLIYLSALLIASNQFVAGLPMVVILFQAINFHHYIVDSRIWKVRKKPMQETLELASQ